MIDVASGLALGSHEDFDTLFQAWLTGDLLLGSAAEEWAAFLAGPSAPAAGSAVAPAFADDRWRESRLESLLEDMPEESQRRRCGRNFERLANGEAEIVITGQQPGFLGGPLYTLFKVASTVEAAAARTGAGRPTIPVFWSGDDDDDRREAFAPRVFDPQRNTLLKAIRPPGAADMMVGAAPAKQWAIAGEAWLSGQTWRNSLAGDLFDLWEDGRRHGLSWGRLQTRGLLRLFRESDLIVVSGNDSGLHRAATPFYERVLDGGSALLDAVAEGAARLAGSGFRVQIGEKAQERYIHLAEGRRRHSLPPQRLAADWDPERLRPGVVMRSPVQDWLFRPAGVVVGPGELAYLKQLEPFYGKLGLHRSPLLPRLFATIVPPLFQDAYLETDVVDDQEIIRARAAEIAGVLDGTIRSTLQQSGDVDLEKENDVLTRMLRRLERDLVGMLGRSHRRRTPETPMPDWLRPKGRRQERTMATMWAAAIWGDDLVGAALSAARAFHATGSAGRWREFLILADLPPAGRKEA